MSQDTITAAVFIGIHLRSESVHALAVTEHGDIVAEANAPYPKKNNPPSQKGFIEENPEVWWEGTRLAVGHLISQLRNRLANASQLKAVSVSCQPGALVALDRRNVPVLPAILADDERGFDYVKSLNFHGREHCERNGFVFRASDPIAKIAWIKDNHPNLYEDAVFVHQADFILGRLKGSPDVTEYSFAARTGCDLIDENWPDWLDYDMYLSVRDRLPSLAHFGTKIGTVTPQAAAATGLPAGIEVIMGTTSHVAEFIASGARKTGDFHTVLADHLTISGIAPKLIHSSQIQVICHKLPDWVWMYSVESRTGAEWIKNWFSENAFQELESQAVNLLPCSYLAYPNVSKGETFPFVSNRAEGFISPATDDREVQFASCIQGTAMFEQFCYQRLDALAAAADSTGDIYTGGHWAASDFWMQCRADVMGRINRRMKGGSGTAYGTAMIAAFGSMFHSFEPLADAMLAVEGTFFPNPDMHTRYNELYKSFCALMEEQGYINSSGVHNASDVHNPAS